MRDRYDRERGIRRSLRATGGRDPRADGRVAPRPVRQRPTDTAEALDRFLSRVADLTPDEIDRLACAEPPPIAFGATLNLHPLVTLVVTIGAGALFGMAGLILAAPLTSAISHIVRELSAARTAAVPDG